MSIRSIRSIFHVVCLTLVIMNVGMNETVHENSVIELFCNVLYVDLYVSLNGIQILHRYRLNCRYIFLC